MVDANERYADICQQVFDAHMEPLTFTSYKRALVTGKTFRDTTRIAPIAGSFSHEKGPREHAENFFLKYAKDLFDAIKDDGLVYPNRLMMEKFERASGLDKYEQGVHRMIGAEEGGIFGADNHAVYMMDPPHVLALAMIAEVLELWYKYPVLRVYIYKDVYMRALKKYHYTVVLGECGGVDRHLARAGVDVNQLE